jgi:hypothetical protein
LISPGLTFLIKQFARGWIDLIGCYAERILVRGRARTQPNSEIGQIPIVNPSPPSFIPSRSVVQLKLQAYFLDQVCCGGLPDPVEVE